MATDKVIKQRKAKPLTHRQSLSLAKTFISNFIDAMISKIDEEYELGVDASLEDKERLKKSLSSLKSQNDKNLTYLNDFNAKEESLSDWIDKAKQKY